MWGRFFCHGQRPMWQKDRPPHIGRWPWQKKRPQIGIPPGNRTYNVKTILGGIFLKDYIEERAVEIASYIIENNATVRQTAKAFGVSKSTVHKDVTDRLMQINPVLAKQARKVLDVNKSERHIRGGLATKEKYLHLA